MSKLNTSHLVLKPVMVNGKLQHRWVDPNTNKEHAEFGSKIKFEHHGKIHHGTVGSVIKSGEYAVKGENGTVYNKHRHQFDVVGKEVTKQAGESKIKSTKQESVIEEKKEPKEKSEAKIAQEKSLENLKFEISKKKDIEERLENLGFAKHHKNFSVLNNTFEKFEQKAKEIIELNKKNNFVFYFDFDAGWYDKKTKASLQGYIGMDKFRLKDEFPEEFEEYRKKYPRGLSSTPLEYWAAGKLSKIIKGKPEEKSEGSNGFSQSGSKMYNSIAYGEIS